MMKRVLSFLLCVAMVVTMLPVQTIAADDVTVPAEAVTESMEETTAPSEEENEPAEEETTVPTEAETEPTEEPTSPVEEETEPAVETTVPAEVETQPVEETTMPTEETLVIEEIEPVLADAEDIIVVASGTCGAEGRYDNTATWKLDSAGTLTISGTGQMSLNKPWDSRRENIISVVIEEGITSIASSAFFQCTNLTNVDIPGTVKVIGDHAFAECFSLTEIVIPEGVCFIGSWAFYWCKNLRSVSLPDSLVTMVDNCIFAGCYSLTSIIIPKNIPYIGDSTFSGCWQLTEITLPKELKWIGSSAFDRCNALETVNYGGSEEDWQVLMSNTNKNNNACLVNAPEKHFGGGEESAYIDAGMCGGNAFWSLDKEGHLTICGMGQISGALPWNTYTMQIRSVTIEHGITAIENEAFKDCTNLTKIIIPAKVGSVLEDAFVNCTGLTSAGPIGSGADYEFGWTETIARGAFCNLTNLTSIIWPEGLKTIDKMAFQNTGLTKVIIPEGVCDINQGAFSDCGSLERVALPSTLNSVHGEAFKNCPKLRDVFIMSDAITIRENAFQDSSEIVNVIYAVSDRNMDRIVLKDGNSALTNAEQHFNWNDVMECGVEQFDVVWKPLTEELTVCVSGDDIRYSFFVIVGMKDEYDNAAEFKLEQNGQYLKTDKGRSTFDCVVSADAFVSGEDVYAVLLDDTGAVVYRERMNIRCVDHYTITYEFGDGREPVYETYTKGELIQEPKKPTRAGYAFCGWYMSDTFDGLEFFSGDNVSARSASTGDFTLYAKWEKYDPGSLVMGVETWGKFFNGNKYFDANHYELSPSDYRALKAICSKTELSRIDKKRFPKDKDDNPVWGGSCFGMSSVVVLAKAGYLDISNFAEDNESITVIGDATLVKNNDGDNDVGKIESMINFYYLRQYFKELRNLKLGYGLFDDSDNLRRIIEKMQSVDEPVLLYVELEKEGRDGSHAVVAFDIKEEEPGKRYSFEVYDCSSVNTWMSYPVEVNVIDNRYYAVCREWKEIYGGKYIFFKCVMTAEELAMRPLLLSPGGVYQPSGSLGLNANMYELETGYGDFSITNGKQSAVIQDGALVSGDLNIICHGTTNMIGESTEYLYEIPILSTGEEYTISYTDSGKQTTSCYLGSSSDGFYSYVSATGAGNISIGSDGGLSTHFEEETEHEIRVTHNDMDTPWYVVDVTGTSTGFSVTPAANTVAVVSETETKVNVTTKDGITGVTLNDVPAGTDEILIHENENKDCVVTQDGEVLASGKFCYSVTFRVPGKDDSIVYLPAGSLIPEEYVPTDANGRSLLWYTDETYINAWNMKTDILSNNMILYGKTDTRVKNRVDIATTELNGQTSVWIDGEEYQVNTEDGISYVDIDRNDAETMTIYTYGTADGKEYPVSMKVWTLENDNGFYTAIRQEDFDDILQYAGVSIRVTGKKGIRMITAIDQEKKKDLITDGLAGYTLKEYGTVIAWASQINADKPLVLGQSYVKSNYAYKQGVADPIFANKDGTMQYTNVLVNFSDEQCKKDIAMRPYMILTDGENDITLYGGIVERSIGYIAAQNAYTFDPEKPEEKDAHDYIWNIIRYVYGEDFVPEKA